MNYNHKTKAATFLSSGFNKCKTVGGPSYTDDTTRLTLEKLQGLKRSQCRLTSTS